MTKTYIIAEAGVNHNGSMDLALKMVSEAKLAGADAIKFQTFKTEELVAKNAPLVDYQIHGSKADNSQFEMIKSLELSFDEFRRIKLFAEEVKIDFLSTPDDVYSLVFLAEDLRVSQIKIGSGEVDNIPFLRQVGKSKLPVILSTGMSFMSEVETAVKELKDNGCISLSLLHCTSQYPCPDADVNLRAMRSMQNYFKLPIGYSDHTIGFEASASAVAMGATILEKHFTLDRTLPGPDHRASLSTADLRLYVDKMRKIECLMGTDVKEPTAYELQNRIKIRRRILSKRDLSKGTLLTDEHLTFKRAENGLFINSLPRLLGKRLLVDKIADEPVMAQDVK